jgi:hypothetical protein
MKEFFSSNDYLEIPGVQELKYQTYAREYIAYHFHREGNLAPAKEDMLTYSKFLFSNGKRDGQNMTKEYARTMKFLGTPRNLETFLNDYFVPHRKRQVTNNTHNLGSLTPAPLKCSERE